MSDQAEHDPHLDALRSIAEHHRSLKADNDEYKSRAENAERALALSEQQNKSLRVELKKASGERDHFRQAFHGSQETMRNVGSLLLDGINRAKNHAYSGAAAEAEIEQQRLNDESVIPKMPLRGGTPRVSQPDPQSQQRRPRVDFRNLAERLMPAQVQVPV